MNSSLVPGIVLETIPQTNFLNENLSSYDVNELPNVNPPFVATGITRDGKELIGTGFTRNEAIEKLTTLLITSNSINHKQ